MAVLVVGGAGYIGSHAALALKRRGYEAIIYDNLGAGHAELAQGFELIVGDIADASKLAPILRRVDAVMHFAAHAYVGESVVNPRKYFQNNVLDGVSLLNAVLDSKVRKFIFSSSCAVYGIPAKVPMTEDMPRVPVNPYGVTKLIFEQALEAYGPAYGLGYMNLRYFNAAGADESGTIGEMHSPETHSSPRRLKPFAASVQRSRFLATSTPLPTAPACAITSTSATWPRPTFWRSNIWLAELRRRSIWEPVGDILCAKFLSAIKRVTGREVPSRMAPPRPGDPAGTGCRPDAGRKAAELESQAVA